MDSSQSYWRKCSTCKRPIAFGADYYLCSVSTCRKKRTGFAFCSVPCWDGHLGFANHRESYAEEAKAPMTAEVEAGPAPMREKRRIIVGSTPSSAAVASASSRTRQVDTLVVVSKVKKLIKDEVDYSTSQCAIDALTQKVVEECLKGIENAQKAGRRTVMGRDIK